jgi:hypothetical protein
VLFISSCPGYTGLTGALDQSNRCESLVGFASGELLDSCVLGSWCCMDLPRPTTSVGTRTDYSVGPWDYPACATRHLMA